MVEVGIRELKGRLSYYVQLAEAGELVAIKIRNRIVSFISNIKPMRKSARPRRRSPQDIHQLVERWKREGFILSGGPYRPRSFKPIKMGPGSSTTEIIRQMRDKEWR